ncbi:MAG: Na/Pi cotransporter family protein [Clostridia bacterium]|nr:Na/Pi cotransporter family protein [Clostridia bacterium]
MEVFYRIVALLGGLAMFLYGMRVMGDGLKACSGTAMRTALGKVTNKPFMGFLLGVFVTCLIQSSTATIVLTVGLVGAGLLTFKQSIGIVLGANVGTAITAQIIRLMDISSDASGIIYFFKADNLAPMALIIGMVIIMTAKKNAKLNAGNICAGFGILFMGLIFMSQAVSSLGDGLSNLLMAFEDNYALGFLAGVGVTGVVQSSSAVVGIIQTFASSVGVSVKGIFAVIIGVNIGDCLTTYIISRIGATPVQIRTAVVHVIYNIFAAVLVILGIIVFKSTGIISDELWVKTLNSGGVANMHGIFRLVPAVLLLPCAGIFEKLAIKIVPDKGEPNEHHRLTEMLAGLDDRLMKTPALALEQVDNIINTMAKLSREIFEEAVKQVYEYNDHRNQKIDKKETILDEVADRANHYLVSISPYISTEKLHELQNLQVKSVICFERIGDLAVNINTAVNTLRASDSTISADAYAELEVAIDAIYEILDLTIKAYEEDSVEIAKRIEPLEEVIDDIIETLGNRHIARMIEGSCNALAGIHYQSILQNLEHISDKCSDLAIYIIEKTEEAVAGMEHKYIYDLHRANDEFFETAYRQGYEKYFNKLEK